MQAEFNEKYYFERIPPKKGFEFKVEGKEQG
jgi:hypothetical protein